MKVKRFNEFEKVNESSVDGDMLDEMMKTTAFDDLKREFAISVTKFEESMKDDLNYDEGDNDQYLAFKAALQEAMDDSILYGDHPELFQ